MNGRTGAATALDNQKQPKTKKSLRTTVRTVVLRLSVIRSGYVQLPDDIAGGLQRLQPLWESEAHAVLAVARQ